MQHPTDPSCTILSNAAPSWASLHLLSYAAFLRAMLHLVSSVLDPDPDPYVFGPPESGFGTVIYLYGSGTVLCCTLLSYSVQCACPLRYTTPYRARLHPSDLRCTLLKYTAPAELLCTLTELPPELNIFRMPECRTVRHLVSLVSEWKEVPMPEPICYRNKET